MGLLSNLTGWHALIIVGVVVLLFGARKLPSLARGIGQSMRILREELPSRARDDPGRDSTLAAADVVDARTDASRDRADITSSTGGSTTDSRTKE
ncbi:twin-arginine translocase TatA/TatE family subunit [Plantibacter sp. YIM 135347]|uniref:twin-arginine translocase TatA/TatE family subunit n=1 Tax=Plantibacter sp. YIM 135347 TaxID=3423919 RepID=UPI003D330142